MRVSSREISYQSADGLALFARDHGPVNDRLTPVICLPGLTRNCKDFETVAPRLAAQRRVICPDFRGRGRSQYAADPLTYRPDVEMADTLALMDHLGVERAAVIGTSRGGIVAMFMAAKAKDRLAGVAFNDIGPRIDTNGLLRIRTYLGTDPKFTTWDAAIAALASSNPGFTSLDADEWLAFARRVYREENGRPRADYDPAIAAAFPTVADISAGKVAELWGLYDLLAPLPALVLRGENSDLLSAETVAEMQRRHPALAAVAVADRGHVPFLDEAPAITAIDGWLTAVDAGRR